MVAANDTTVEQPEVNPEVPTEEGGNNAAAAGEKNDDVEVELTKEEMLAALPTLMAEGQRAFITNDFENAAEKFSIATEYAVSVYGDEFAPECFDAYYKYGRALASLALLESEDPQVEFDSVRDYISKMAEERAEKLQGAKEQPNLDDSRVGNPDEVRGEERDEIVAAVDNALEENAQELDKLGEKSEETMEDLQAEKEEEAAVPEEPKAKEEAPKADTKKDDATVETEAKEDVDMNKTVDVTQEDTEMEEGEEEEENVPSANLAWDILEVARKICEKQGESKEWELKKVNVLSVLGELSIHEDKFEDAIADLQTALDISKKYLEENDRVLASAYYELGNAYRHNDNYLQASELMKKAKEILDVCFENAKAAGDSDKIKELETVVKDFTTDYEDCLSSYKDSEKKKALKEKEEVKQVSPEKPKENLEPAGDITSNIRKGKRPAEAEPEEAKKAKLDEEPAAAEIPADPVA